MTAETTNASSDHAARRFQFSLRALLLFVAAASVLFAVMSMLGKIWALALGLGLLMVAGHVFGNALGTRMQTSWTEREDDVEPPPTVATRPIAQPEPTKLRQCIPLGRLLRWLMTIGAAAGATIGFVLLTYVSDVVYLPRDLVLGIFSFGVLGSLAGFLGGSFVHVMFSAFGEARHSEEKHNSRKRPSADPRPGRHRWRRSANARP